MKVKYYDLGGGAVGWGKSADFSLTNSYGIQAEEDAKRETMSLMKGWISMKVGRKRMLSERVEDKAEQQRCGIERNGSRMSLERKQRDRQTRIQQK